jgi:hypothetical protein
VRYTVTPAVAFGMSGDRDPRIVEALGWPLIDGVRDMDCARCDRMRAALGRGHAPCERRVRNTGRERML